MIFKGRSSPWHLSLYRSILQAVVVNSAIATNAENCVIQSSASFETMSGNLLLRVAIAKPFHSASSDFSPSNSIRHIRPVKIIDHYN